MRLKGNLTKWNDERGFGFITPTDGGQNIFVHISAFPKNEMRPVIGETLIFEITTNKGGEKRAKNISYPQRTNAAHKPSPHRRNESSPRRREKNSGLPGWSIVPLLILAGLCWHGYDKYFRAPAPASRPVISAKSEDQEMGSRSYSCDGRTHCSQMTSCEEATYFIQHCPNTKMDGNNDGVPCERQWCR
jgi:cold shock CspA family protein